MDISWQTILSLAARHALTTFGGWMIAHGYLQSSGLDGFVGAGMVVAGVAWSWWQKSGQAFALNEARRYYDDIVEKMNTSKKPPAPSVVKQ